VHDLAPYHNLVQSQRCLHLTSRSRRHLLNQNDYSAPEEEGWSILAALLALTTNIRGGLLVTSNTFRHPSLLGKIVTTIDRISGGRVEVGLGAGWMSALRPASSTAAEGSVAPCCLSHLPTTAGCGAAGEDGPHEPGREDHALQQLTFRCTFRPTLHSWLLSAWKRWAP